MPANAQNGIGSTPAVPHEMQTRFAEAKSLYKPNHLKLLFIAEAPPAYRVNRFFYFSGLKNGDTLFLEMMKVLYPAEVGFHHGAFQPGFSVQQMRQQKPALLRRFQHDGYYLIDACDEPMPDGADTATKMHRMRASLPALLRNVRQIVNERSIPIVLIGAVTYSVCAEALRLDGRNVRNNAMINHPARGGQTLFRSKLQAVLSSLYRTPQPG
jgi:hypothetical protein